MCGIDQGKATRPDHVKLAARQNLAGTAARWCLRQGLVSLALHIVAMLAFTVAAFSIIGPLGWAVLGVSCLAMEYLTREEGR